jgi:hypothetical protein
LASHRQSQREAFPRNEGPIGQEKISMNSSEIPTVTERQLFAEFLKLEVSTTVGRSYQPDDLFNDPGSYGTIEDFTSALADAVAEEKEPGSYLDTVIQDLDSYLTNLKVMQRDFAALKASRLANDDEENPRYSLSLPEAGRQSSTSMKAATSADLAPFCVKPSNCIGPKPRGRVTFLSSEL